VIDAILAHRRCDRAAPATRRAVARSERWAVRSKAAQPPTAVQGTRQPRAAADDTVGSSWTTSPRAEQQPWAPRRRWYGWQTLLVDGASIGLLVLGVAADDRGAGRLGALGYFFGAPIVHWSHGHVGKGFASLGLRVGSVLVLSVAAFGCYGGKSAACYLGLSVVPGVVAIDSASIAREDVPATESSYGIAPYWSSDGQAGGARLWGRF
jgi:hypothetical protein